jgi:Endopolygalacturonase
MRKLSRRHLLQGVATLAVTGCSQGKSEKNAATASTTKNSTDEAWAAANEIAANINIPTFPTKTFDIRDFGATANNDSDSSQAINDAIAACAKAGGGKVLVSGGSYLSGPIHLLSNINLHIDEGATIKFKTNPDAYLPAVFTRWEGMEMMGYSPLIYAFEQTNVALTGKGTLDGQAAPTIWWAWKGNKTWGLEGHPSQKESRDQLFAQAEAGEPVEERNYADGHYLRPSFVQPYRCKNVLIEDITIINAPFWLLHPTLCEDVTVRGVHLQSLGPNSDGCDPESCKNVLIENCYFDTGDDCIAIKSGRNNDGRRLAAPCENIIIRNCKMSAGHGGVVIGSEISGGVRNVFAENNEMSSPDLDRGFRIKTNSVRGGVLENLYMRNCTIGEVRDAIVINFNYEEGDAGQFDPTVRNVHIENLKCGHAKRAFQVRGFKRAPISDLYITNVVFERADDPGIIENVDGLHLSDVKINGAPFTL